MEIKQNKESNKAKEFPLWHQFEDGVHSLVSPNFIEPPQSKHIPENSENISNIKSTFECFQKLKKDMYVMSEWGVAKVVSVDEDNGICRAKVEGQEVELDISTINFEINVIGCVIDKSKSSWIDFKVQINENVKLIKEKFAKLYKVHYTQVVVVYNGEKLKDNSKVYDSRMFNGCQALIVIKDKEELNFRRFKNIKTINLFSGFNSVYVTVNDDVKITKLGLYKNNTKDIFYEIIIKDENKKILYQAENVIVEKGTSNNQFDDSIEVFTIGNEVILHKDKKYEIQENITSEKSISGQLVGFQPLEDGGNKNGAIFTFKNGSEKDEKENKNSTTVEIGLIPIIYYSFYA